MKVCSTENMQIAERELIVSGTPARTLMKLASAGIAESLMQFFPDPGLCVAYVGKGNNGGDALTVLNILKQHGWEIGFRTAYPRNEWSELSVRQLAEISPPPQEYQAPPLPHTGKPMILLDGLLGIGAKGMLRREISALCAEMNYIRNRCGAVRTVAIDIPTGVDPDTGMPQQNAVEADFTMCIGAVKQGLLDDDATLFAGRLVCIDLPGLHVQALPATELITSSRLTKFLSARPYTDYKNKRGHIGVIAGSEGMLGAARLCCEAALRSRSGYTARSQRRLSLNRSIHASGNHGQARGQLRRYLHSYIQCFPHWPRYRFRIGGRCGSHPPHSGNRYPHCSGCGRAESGRGHAVELGRTRSGYSPPWRNSQTSARCRQLCHPRRHCRLLSGRT